MKTCYVVKWQIYAFLLAKIMVSRHKNMHTSLGKYFPGAVYASQIYAHSLSATKNSACINAGSHAHFLCEGGHAVWTLSTLLTFLFISTNQLCMIMRARLDTDFRGAHLLAVGGNYYTSCLCTWNVHRPAICREREKKKKDERAAVWERRALPAPPSLSSKQETITFFHGNYPFVGLPVCVWVQTILYTLCIY